MTTPDHPAAPESGQREREQLWLRLTRLLMYDLIETKRMRSHDARTEAERLLAALRETPAAAREKEPVIDPIYQPGTDPSKYPPAAAVRVISQNAAHGHLKAMLEADQELYERCLDTPVFAFHFNALAKIATDAAPAAAQGTSTRERC